MNTVTIVGAQAPVTAPVPVLVRSTALDQASAWIQDLIDHTGWRPTVLAKKSGVAPSTVTRIYNGEDHRFQPSLKTLQKLARAADYPIPRAVIEACGADRLEAGDPPSPTPRSVREALSTLSHTSKLGKHLSIPVRYVSSLPSSLHPVGQRTMTTRCPPKLENDDTAFAFQCPDNSLDPWIKAGSMLYAVDSREPAVGDLVLITSKDGRSKVRMLTDMDETGMILSRPSPFGSDESVAYGDYDAISVVAAMDRF